MRKILERKTKDSLDMLKRLLTCCLMITSLQIIADTTLEQLYHSPDIKLNASLPTRIKMFSTQFLGKPYLLGALGEGVKGYYDNTPLYRTDAFDCETYVDTVLALAFAHDSITFEQKIRQIRYQNGHVSFFHRNHFTCLDWNKNNQKQGLIKDITTTLHDKNSHSIAKMAHALIDKPGWYQHFSTAIIRMNNPLPAERAKRLASLKQKGSQLPRMLSTIPYIPLTILFNKAGQANEYVFKQIPDGAIVEIVRPNWDLTQQIGTHLNVSHLGFAIWIKDTLMFRAASSTNGRIMDIPLIDYLRNAQKIPTIKGINVQIATPVSLSNHVHQETQKEKYKH